VTDYDVWKDEPVDMDMVLKTMSECLSKVLRLLELGLPRIQSCGCSECIEAAKGAGAL
jgi:5'-methylthioadenosine phosphorylase